MLKICWSVPTKATCGCAESVIWVAIFVTCCVLDEALVIRKGRFEYKVGFVACLLRVIVVAAKSTDGSETD